MIHKIERLGTEKEAEGWFLINELVKIRYVEDDEGLRADIEFDEEIITEQEAQELANELIKVVLEEVKQAAEQ